MTTVENLHGINLPARYEIRPVSPEHWEWCRALLTKEMLLRAPVWRPLVRDPKIKTVLQHFKDLKKFHAHSLESGLSYALYDKEYKFKRPESAVTGGALYWHEIDIEDSRLEEQGPQWMLDKMDFPIVALALSYDLFASPTNESRAIMADVAPLWLQMMKQYYSDASSTIPGLPVPTSLGQYVHRSGCVTRTGYERQGLGRLLSWWVCLEMQAKGYKGILIGAGNASISPIYMRDDAPFKSTYILEQDMSKMEINMGEEKVRPWLNGDWKDFKYVLVHLTQRIS